MDAKRLVVSIAVLLAALPLAGCGNKGPLTLQPQPSGPPPSAARAATGMMTPESPATVAPPAASTVDAPADPTGSAETLEADIELRDDALDSHDDADATPTQTPTEADDGTPGTPR